MRTHSVLIRNGYYKFNLINLSTEARGALWTMIAYEGIPMSEAALESVLGPKWISLLNTLTAYKFGKLTKKDDSYIFSFN